MKIKSTKTHKATPLTSIVQPKSEYVRSANVERDTFTLDAFAHYVSDSTIVDVIRRVVVSMNKSKSGRAFSITGPYGSGKSTLAVFLEGLLSAKKDPAYEQSKKFLDSISSEVSEILEDGRHILTAQRNGFIRCTITSQSEPVSISVIRALDRGARKYFGNKYSNKHFATASALHNAINVVENATIKGNIAEIPDARSIRYIVAGMCEKAPVLLLLDEFGKNMEYFAKNDSVADMYLLQMLAEYGSGKKALPLFLITLQHMAFEEYSEGISAPNRREWSKVQGRFDDIPFSNSPQQTWELISNSIDISPFPLSLKTWSKNQHKKLLKITNKSIPSTLQIGNCYPLHPLSLVTLPELCTRYGQHERTLLSFMVGSGKNTVHDFLDNNNWDPQNPSTVGLDVLYDYFISGHRSVHNHTSANITLLMEIHLVIRDSHGLSNLASKVLKTIGLLNLLSISGPLRASSSMLEYAIGKDYQSAIQELRQRSIITYREYADEFRVWRGTDVDLQSSIDIIRHRYTKTPLHEILEKVQNLDSMVAARHGIRKGTMRTFERGFLDNKGNRIYEPENDDGLVLYSSGDMVQSTKKIAKPVIIVESRDDLLPLRHSAIDALSIKEILDTDPNVSKDWVARKELWERMEWATSSVEEEFRRAYDQNATWWYINPPNGKKIKLSGTGGMAISQASDLAYDMMPRILNEMINRNHLSAQSSRARALLVNSMINHEHDIRFNIKGWGPERAMYEAIFANTKLHIKSSKNWNLVESGGKFKNVWIHVMKYLGSNKERRINLNEIYMELQKPPFGIKLGLIPIIIISMFVASHNKIALYEHGTYCPELEPQILERMYKNPKYFEFKYFGDKMNLRRSIITAVAKEMEITSKSNNVEILDIVGKLVKTIVKLQKYTKHTKSFKDKHTLKVRDAIINATEPDTLLFDLLPQALNIDLFGKHANVRTINKFAKNLARSLHLLENTYDGMINDLVIELLDVSGIGKKEDLVSVAANLKNQIKMDPKMLGILNAISVGDLDDSDWITYIAMVLTDVPPTDWTDQDKLQFSTNLAEFAAKFKRILAIHVDKIKKSGSVLHRITITENTGQEYMSMIQLDDKYGTKFKTDVHKLISKIKNDKNIKTEENAINTILAILGKKLGVKIANTE